MNYYLKSKLTRRPLYKQFALYTIVTRSWLQTADFFEEFPCLVHKLSVILAAFYKSRLVMARVRYTKILTNLYLARKFSGNLKNL